MERTRLRRPGFGVSGVRDRRLALPHVEVGLDAQRVLVVPHPAHVARREPVGRNAVGGVESEAEARRVVVDGVAGHGEPLLLRPTAHAQLAGEHLATVPAIDPVVAATSTDGPAFEIERFELKVEVESADGAASGRDRTDPGADERRPARLLVRPRKAALVDARPEELHRAGEQGEQQDGDHEDAAAGAQGTETATGSRAHSGAKTTTAQITTAAARPTANTMPETSDERRSSSTVQTRPAFTSANARAKLSFRSA